MNVLCHAGPWSSDYLKRLVEELDLDLQHKIVSGHKVVDESGVWLSYIEGLDKYSNQGFVCTDWDREIIARCRLLRSLSDAEAMLHLNAMKDAISNAFDQYLPGFVLTETVDSFVLDLFAREAERRGIPCIGLVTSFVNGYFRISVRGEYNESRTVEHDEVQRVLKQLLTPTYTPTFVQKDRANLRYRVLKKWLRNLVKIPYFWILRRLSGDFYNNHYWQTYIMARQNLCLFPRIKLHDDNWLLKVESSKKPIVFVPLQMFPEATIDYWCEDLEAVKYENALCQFIMRHPDIVFLVKEHPNVAGYRNNKLYTLLHSCQNAIFCPTDLSPNSISHLWSAVLVWTGSVGFESMLRGVKVLSPTRVYYAAEGSEFCKIPLNIDSRSLLDVLNGFDKSVNPVSHVEYLLSGLLPGKIQFDGSWDESNSEHVKNLKQVATSLRAYLIGKGIRLAAQ